ncbi:MAG: ABC transporter substrate-binding protein [Oscillospiraceae bacterium]|nr:ABC transporter substrate-binding protein [Oscillospiraceae bacterium]
MKKILAITLCVLMALTLFAGCTNGDVTREENSVPTTEKDNNKTNGNTDTKDDPVDNRPATKIRIWFMGGGADNDDRLVVEAANARLRELGLNIEIDPIWTGGWAMGDEAQIALNTGDNVDIYWTASWGLNYFNNARVGNFFRLDDPDNNLLNQYGREMKNIVSDVLWDAFVTDGPSGNGIYGIPGPKDYAAWFKMDVNNTRLAELGYDFDEIFTMDGSNHEIIFNPVFEEIMQASKDKYGPTFFPLNLEAGNFAQHFARTDGDLTGLGVFMFPYDPMDPTQPKNPTVGLQIEDEMFLRVLDKVRHFWEMGFIDPRLAIKDEAEDVIGSAHRVGEYMFSTGQYAYGHTAAMREERGIDVRYVPLSVVPIVSTMSAAGSGFGISVYSKNPEAAMQFMNAWYTDNELAVILCEGVEGVHWNFDSEGLVELDRDARESYATWRNGMGNVFILSPRTTDGHGFFEAFEAYNALGVGTTFVGFIFDNEPVSVEMAALTSVINEYSSQLTVGAIDPKTAVPDYLAALKANGIDRVLDELNTQLREFYASR